MQRTPARSGVHAGADPGQRFPLAIFLTINTVPLPLATAPVHRIPTVRHLAGAERALVLWHLTSLDAPTVAAVWSLALAWCPHLHLRPWTPLLLALTTWCIYVGDRLLDARTGLRGTSRTGLRERHTFHWRHRRVLLPMAAITASVAAAIFLAFTPSIVRERGWVLAIASFFYLSGVHLGSGKNASTRKRRRSFPTKEFFVGVLFTAGCALPSWPQMEWLRADQSALWPFWIPVACFAALAWLNCACIARWETMDAWRESHSRALLDREQAAKIAVPACFAAAILLVVVTVVLAAIALPAHPRTSALLTAGSASALLLALLDSMRDRIEASTLRAAADLALLTPVILLLR